MPLNPLINISSSPSPNTKGLTTLPSAKVGNCTLERAQSEATHAISSYFFHLNSLKKNEQWQEIIMLGEEALLQERQLGSLSNEQQFSIRDQLVSTYFRLGNFSQALLHAEAMGQLATSLPLPSQMEGLYKKSAALRGMAGSSSTLEERKTFFTESRTAAEKALQLYKDHSLDQKGLKARILFNAGAAECDDEIEGNADRGANYYKEALSLFCLLQEEDYLQRTMLRLGKVHLLQNSLEEARAFLLKRFNTVFKEHAQNA